MTRETRQALLQALTCGSVVAVVVAAVLVVSHQPADADELRLPVAELRSQAAELDLLRRLSATAAVTPRFARAQAQQLAKRIDASREELASMPVQARLADARAAGRAFAAQVDAAATRPDADLPVAPLQALENSLRR